SHKQTAKLAVEQGQRVDVCDEQGMLQLCSCPILLKYGDRSYSKAVITAEFAESADATLRSVASMMLDQLALQISDQISSMFILHNDLANARAMTTALKVENERLEMFLDHINGGVGILDRDLRVVWSNFETDKKFGLGDQVSGKHCYELMHGRTTPCDNCVALKTFETGQPETGYNNVKSQNGKSCYFRYHVSPILGSFGNVEQAIVFAQDVTEQHLVELELQKRTEMLEIEHQRVLDASRQRTQLFATVSHDLRTPLTSIIGFSEILLEETDGPLTTRQREMLRRVNQNAERLLGMISDILDLSRLESGKMTVNLSRIGLPLLVNQIVETFQPLVKDKELLL
ncbi:MAG TPA: histidine kinase dimerization/phospho-acceptor domain-containing protein, partial [Armatimonadota bacterium]|nr:histidine kinase dimerization/phospho-acceptor domain-containing protein [Armatimonadota bacterium]